MILVKKVNVGALLLILSHCALQGQTLQQDSIIAESALRSTIKLYDLAMGENSHLYNGREFINPFERKEANGHIYYITDEWQDGFIYYAGQLYEHVSLRFDVFQNKVIVEHPRSHREIELDSKKISSFGLNGLKFVRLISPTEGFYAEIYKGEVKVYIWHYKTLKENTEGKTMVREFPAKEKVYILKDETYHLVSTQSAILSVFKERKSELKKLIKEERLSFKANKEYTLSRMARYYDQLNADK